MKKQITKISTLALALLSFGVFAQEGKIQPCNTYEAMEQAFKDNPSARKNYEDGQLQLQRELLEKQTNAAAKSTAAAFEYTIPVVFHVLYECNGQTISDADLIQALEDVNNDYSRNSPDTNLIVNPFKTSYINSDIKFMLAKRDINGNCINGIVRHLDDKTHWDQGIANLNSVIGNSYWPYTWDATKYLNIYVVTEIIPQGTVTGGGVIVGYTYKPGTWGTNNPHDAIVYDMDFLTGTSGGVPRTRSLSHEAGHWLSLAHTFGNTNNPGTVCGDDGIYDTPVTKGEFGGCASSFTSACNQPNPALVGLNNVQNIMNYSDCARNFTTDQTTAMRNALASNLSGRNNLWDPTTIIFTDVNGAGNCLPVAEFFPTSCAYTVCQGSSLTMKDYSWNSTVTSVAWTADNGATIASPSSTLTSILFTNVGTTNVSLSVTNSLGTSVQTRAITVMDATPGITGPYMESFEAPGVPPNWAVINPDSDPVEWIQTTAAAYDQTTSYMIEGAQNTPSHSDILQMPIMDVLHNQTNIFQFAYAYRQMSSTQNDVLRIEGSKDCGGTWNTIFSMNASLMQSQSGGVSTDPFVPFINEWKNYTISSHPNWQSYKTSESVLVRFNFIEGTNGFGNNMYIDAINFFSVTGVNELTKSILFNMYPNPTTGEAAVNFRLNDPAKIKISVVDVMGREVLPSVENTYSAGDQTISINKNSTLAKGIYFVNLTHNGAKMSSKLVID